MDRDATQDPRLDPITGVPMDPAVNTELTKDKLYLNVYAQEATFLPPMLVGDRLSLACLRDGLTQALELCEPMGVNLDASGGKGYTLFIIPADESRPLMPLPYARMSIHQELAQFEHLTALMQGAMSAWAEQWRRAAKEDKLGPRDKMLTRDDEA